MGGGIDVSSLHKNHDVVLIPDAPYIDIATIFALRGIENTNIPVIAGAGDPHTAKKFDVLFRHKKLKINYYFSLYAPSSFYKYYPKHFKYETIIHGLEPSLYSNLRPYNERVHDRIAISGALGNHKLTRRIFHRIVTGRPKDLTSWYHYKLRTKCNSLPYVYRES